jgi:tetratricopeptide (TPR) repeat protein
MRRLAWLSMVCLLSACAKTVPPASVATESADEKYLARLSAAQDLVRAGCLDCLIEAFHEYTELQMQPVTATAAQAGRGRTAALIAIRQAELGILDEGYWEHAAPSRLLDVIRTLTIGPVANPAAPDAARLRRLLVGQPDPVETARVAAADNELSAYLWLALACGPLGATSVTAADRLAAVGDLAESAIVLYKDASACSIIDRITLEALLNGDPRFKEVHYFLGMGALAAQSRTGGPAAEPDLDSADHHFRLAYEWRPAWPGVTLPIANLAMTAEEFPRALDFYDQTLSLVPDLPEALLGRVRALTYLARHEEAIAAADPLIAAAQRRGDAYYWRAFNKTTLGRHSEAWADIELAATFRENIEIPKLAGVIAVKRRALDLARRRLEEARDRQAQWRVYPRDCDIGFYLQTVLAEQRDWAPTAVEALETAGCFEAEAARLTREIEQLQASEIPAERKARQIGRRETQLRSGLRRNANARFNAAVANFNLHRPEEAHRLARTLVDDEVFGDRARDIVTRTSAVP